MQLILGKLRGSFDILKMRAFVLWADSFLISLTITMKWILTICHDLKHVLEFSQQKWNSDSHSWRLTCFPPLTEIMFLYLFQWEQKKPNSHTWRMNSSAKVSLGAGMVQVELLPGKFAFYVLLLLWHWYLKCCKTKYALGSPALRCFHWVPAWSSASVL